jgi:hypothetical protein
MAFDALAVGGIAALAHLHAFDLIEIVAVEAGFGNIPLFLHHLVADAAFSKVGLVIGVVVTILAGGAVLPGGEVGFVVKEDLARHGLVHDAKGLFRWFGGGCRVTENPHYK